MLTLSEELMLLAVNDDKGHFILSATSDLPYGIAASLILELGYRDIINISEKGIISIKNEHKTDIDFLDFAINIIRRTKKSKDCEFWIRSFALEYKIFKEQIIENLVLKGILKKKAKKFLFLIDFHKYPTLNPAPELETRDKIHKVVLMGVKPDKVIYDLIVLLYCCNLVDEVFPKSLRKSAQKFIKKLTEESKLGKLILKITNEMNFVLLTS